MKKSRIMIFFLGFVLSFGAGSLWCAWASKATPVKKQKAKKSSGKAASSPFSALEKTPVKSGKGSSNSGKTLKKPCAKGAHAQATHPKKLKQKTTPKNTEKAPTASPATATPKLLGTYGEWHAYEAREGGKKVCYMTSFAQTQDPALKGKRGLVYMLVAHRPSLNSRDVVSFDSGYAFKKGTPLEVTVEGAEASRFKLFTERGTAWCSDTAMDQKLTQNLLKGNKISVLGQSEKGLKTKDVYSLKGSKAAYMVVSKACGIGKG